jgi:hypothetical protein
MGAQLEDETLFDKFPELRYIRDWTESMSMRRYEAALETLRECRRFVEERGKPELIHHIDALIITTTKRKAEGSGQQSSLREPVRCSFCNKSEREVSTMIAGPRVFICNECVVLCAGIIEAQTPPL